jgi:anti-sigma factor RsiW
MSRTWHLPAELVDAWASGELGPTVAASVEQHLTVCPACRSAVIAPVAADGTLDLDRVWSRIADQVEPAPVPLVGRLMTRLGMRSHDALVLGAASTFTASWVAATATVVALTFTMSVVRPSSAVAVYLLLAPLVPLAGVAAAYGEDVDPTHELAVAAPYSQLRMLLLRTAAVLLVCVPVTAVAGLALDPWWVAAAWLLPGLALVAVLLVAMSWWSPSVSAGTVGVLWAVVAVTAYRLDETLVLVQATGLGLSAATVGVVGIVLVASRRRLSTRLGTLR